MNSSKSHSAGYAAVLGALGVVFGDIGTSPLYALKESFEAAHGLALTVPNVLGILSMIFWSITLVVSLKYIAFIMHAHNNGEGGIMALLALSLRRGKGTKTRLGVIAVGLFGAGLFFGDGIITPAISVLGAVEGLSIATPTLEPFILPMSLGILFGLFLVQRKGTASVGRYFGPITLVWFVAIGLCGILGILQHPSILKMINPYWAISFVMNHPYGSFLILGAVVLTVTGGEALYADMGHFGRRPILKGWFLIVLPCLLLNYAGQGALILEHPEAIENPFYKLVPAPLLYPMIVLATLAAVIASQAVISGVFSIARQAIQLGYLPRMAVVHTSSREIGQIYIPFLNWLLMLAVFVVVLLFQSSSNLASAYGIAVTLTMMCDTILVSFVMYRLWRWQSWKVLLFFIPFFCLDALFFGATALKLMQGGWVPLTIGLSIFTIMITWKRGKEILAEKLDKESLPLSLFYKSVDENANIVNGTAVFLTSSPTTVPHALLHNLKHNKVLHDVNIMMTVITTDEPYVSKKDRFVFTKHSDHFWSLKSYFGFKELPNVPQVLTFALKKADMVYDPMTISYFVSRERLIHAKGDGMAAWREKLFISMSRNTSSVSDFFQIPSNRVLELGSHIEI